MIGRVHKRGKRVSGLLRYLYGPGKHEEHVNPRMIASWDDDPGLLEPRTSEGGHRDYRRLVRLLEQPLVSSSRAPDATVWHTSLRNDASDRILTDAEWAAIAKQALNDVGIAPYGDEDAVRWIAVRHGDDHIHIVATLVRQDGRVEKGWGDYPALRKSCMQLEKRYRLYSTAPADKTAAPTPGRHEVGKAHRKGRKETYRDQLRRDVRTAVAAAADSSEFWERLRDSGVMIRYRYSQLDPTAITGYAVGLPGHKSADGDTIWYGGGRLAPDLTLPKLRARWGEENSSAGSSAQDSKTRRRFTPDERVAAYDSTTRSVREATDDIRRHTTTDPDQAAAAAQAAGDVLASASRALHEAGGEPLWEATELLDRATRSPYGQPLPRTVRSENLRSMSRLLALAGRISGSADMLAAARLLVDVAALAESIRDLRTAQNLAHQAAAARACATRLRAAANAAFAGAQASPGHRRVQEAAPTARRTI